MTKDLFIKLYTEVADAVNNSQPLPYYVKLNPEVIEDNLLKFPTAYDLLEETDFGSEKEAVDYYYFTGLFPNRSLARQFLMARKSWKALNDPTIDDLS